MDKRTLVQKALIVDLVLKLNLSYRFSYGILRKNKNSTFIEMYNDIIDYSKKYFGDSLEYSDVVKLTKNMESSHLGLQYWELQKEVKNYFCINFSPLNFKIIKEMYDLNYKRNRSIVTKPVSNPELYIGSTIDFWFKGIIMNTNVFLQNVCTRQVLAEEEISEWCGDVVKNFLTDYTFNKDFHHFQEVDLIKFVLKNALFANLFSYLKKVSSNLDAKLTTEFNPVELFPTYFTFAEHSWRFISDVIQVLDDIFLAVVGIFNPYDDDTTCEGEIPTYFSGSLAKFMDSCKKISVFELDILTKDDCLDFEKRLQKTGTFEELEICVKALIRSIVNSYPGLYLNGELSFGNVLYKLRNFLSVYGTSYFNYVEEGEKINIYL